MTGDIRVMTSGAFTAAYLELVPRLELLTEKKLVTAATSIGSGKNSIPNRLRNGETVDVVIVADSVLVGFIKDGLIVAESYTPLATSAIGMAVRAGAPKPDIGTVDALKRTLLRAKSIAYSASVSGEYVSTELFQRLGIADQVVSKSRRIEGGERVGAVVARGEADIGFQQRVIKSALLQLADELRVYLIIDRQPGETPGFLQEGFDNGDARPTFSGAAKACCR